MKYLFFIILVSMEILDMNTGNAQTLNGMRRNVVIKYVRRNRIIRCCGDEKCSDFNKGYTKHTTTVGNDLPATNNENDETSSYDESLTYSHTNSVETTVNIARTSMTNLANVVTASSTATNLVSLQSSKIQITTGTLAQNLFFTESSKSDSSKISNFAQYTATTISSGLTGGMQITTGSISQSLLFTESSKSDSSKISNSAQYTATTISSGVTAGTQITTGTIGHSLLFTESSKGESSTNINSDSAQYTSANALSSTNTNTQGIINTASSPTVQTSTATEFTTITRSTLVQTGTATKILSLEISTTSTNEISTTSTATTTTTGPCVAKCPAITCTKNPRYFKSDGVTLINALSTYGTVRQICSKTYLEVNTIESKRDTVVSACCAIGMRLLEIETLTEYNCLNSLITAGEYFVAGYAMESCGLPYRFAWCGKNATMIDPEIPFYPDEPDNLLGTQSCMSVVFGKSSDKGISDIDCAGIPWLLVPPNLPYICEN